MQHHGMHTSSPWCSKLLPILQHLAAPWAAICCMMGSKLQQLAAQHGLPTCQLQKSSAKLLRNLDQTSPKFAFGILKGPKTFLNSFPTFEHIFPILPSLSLKKFKKIST
jgi:hypothetical protein